MKRSLLLRVTLQLAISLFVIMAALFISAGTLNWTGAWIYVGYALLVSVLTFYGGPLKLDALYSQTMLPVAPFFLLNDLAGSIRI